MRVSLGAMLLVGLLVLGLAAGTLIALRSVHERAPEFTVPTTDNRTFALAEHRGHVVVLDLMATWCTSCKVVEANLKEARTAWNDSEVVIASVDVSPDETIEDLRSYQRDHNITWTMAMDTDEVALKYNVWEIAHVIIIDRAGNVVYSQKGIIGTDELEATVAKALRGELRPVGVLEYGLWGLAIVAGGAAFFSPCAIGLLPGYVAHAVRAHDPERPAPTSRVLAFGTFAALGVLLVFFAVGGLALLVGPALTRYVPYLQPLVGFLLIGLGVLLLARPYSFALQRAFQPVMRWAGAQDQKGGARGYFAYGLGYGAAAASCTTPVLLSIFVTAAAYGPLVGSGIVLAYAGTAAVLMVLITVASAVFREGLARRLVRSSRIIETVAALAFIGGGLFLIWFATRAGAFAS